MKVMVLAENTSMDEFLGEHGLSLYIEHKGKKYLLDTGATGLYAENAKKAGVDLAEIDTAFLSHAHYDHSGGYPSFFEQNKTAKVYLQAACREKYYFKIVGPVRKYIGIPKGLLEEWEDRFVYVNGYQELENGVFLCPHTTEGLEDRARRAHMYGMADDKFFVDNFAHEQTVVFEEADGLYLFNSCSHGGVENIIGEIKRAFPKKELKAFFGGFHMMGPLGPGTCAFSEKEVRDTAKLLLKSSNAVFYTGHCTGAKAGQWLQDEMKDRLVLLSCGMTVSL